MCHASSPNETRNFKKTEARDRSLERNPSLTFRVVISRLSIIRMRFPDGTLGGLNVEAATLPLAAEYENSTVAKATVLHREYTHVMSKIQQTTSQQPELLSLCDVVPEFRPADHEVPGGKQGIPC